MIFAMIAKSTLCLIVITTTCQTAIQFARGDDCCDCCQNHRPQLHHAINGERTKPHWDKTPLGQNPTGQNPTGQNPTAIFGRADNTDR